MNIGKSISRKCWFYHIIHFGFAWLWCNKLFWVICNSSSTIWWICCCISEFRAICIIQKYLVGLSSIAHSISGHHHYFYLVANFGTKYFRKIECIVSFRGFSIVHYNRFKVKPIVPVTWVRITCLYLDLLYLCLQICRLNNWITILIQTRIGSI